MPSFVWYVASPMTKQKQPTSPTLQIEITAEQHAAAIASNSGGCLISDAIKKQYPHLTGIVTDMATIRMTDRAKGVRYTYLTPATAQHILLAFDQGWRNPLQRVTLRRAVKIDRISSTPSKQKARAEHRERRIAELDEKIASGEQLSPVEKRSLTRMKNNKPAPPRPTSKGPITAVITSDATGPATVIGGEPLPQGKPHPNLLRGRDRHFGAKIADPGMAFTEAVEQAVAQKLAELPLA